MHVKLAAICQAMRITNDFRDVYVEIESNSLEVINLIKNEDSFMHEFDIIIDNIRQVLSRKDTIGIKRIFKVANCSRQMGVIFPALLMGAHVC